MFTQKKKSFFKTKKFSILMVLVLSVFGYWVSAELDFKDKNDVQTGYNVSADKEETSGKASGKADNHKQSSENAYEKQPYKSSNSSAGDDYYLVKAKEGIIYVYYYDKEGNETMIEKTDISFSLISSSDQNMLSKGVILSTEDELYDFLQDFES